MLIPGQGKRICNDSSSYSNEMLILPSNSFWWYFPPYSLLPLLESRNSELSTRFCFIYDM